MTSTDEDSSSCYTDTTQNVDGSSTITHFGVALNVSGVGKYSQLADLQAVMWTLFIVPGEMIRGANHISWKANNLA